MEVSLSPTKGELSTTTTTIKDRSWFTCDEPQKNFFFFSSTKGTGSDETPSGHMGPHLRDVWTDPTRDKRLVMTYVRDPGSPFALPVSPVGSPRPPCSPPVPVKNLPPLETVSSRPESKGDDSPLVPDSPRTPTPRSDTVVHAHSSPHYLNQSRNQRVRLFTLVLIQGSRHPQGSSPTSITPRWLRETSPSRVPRVSGLSWDPVDPSRKAFLGPSLPGTRGG